MEAREVTIINTSKRFPTVRLTGAVRVGLVYVERATVERSCAQLRLALAKGGSK